MKRFYYEHEHEHEFGAFIVYDRTRGSNEVMAACDEREDAEQIVEALNRAIGDGE